jgi:hypothetical protein
MLDFLLMLMKSKDLMIVLRHLIGTPYRKALLGQLDKLFNERVLLGAGVGSQETLRLVNLVAFT